MSMTDERLDEIASNFERTSSELQECGMDHTWDADTAAALRELQQLRKLLSSHYDECTGTGCATCIGYADLYPNHPVG